MATTATSRCPLKEPFKTERPEYTNDPLFSAQVAGNKHRIFVILNFLEAAKAPASRETQSSLSQLLSFCLQMNYLLDIAGLESPFIPNARAYKSLLTNLFDYLLD